MIGIIALKFSFGYEECIDMPLRTLKSWYDKAMQIVDKEKEDASRAKSRAPRRH